MSYSPENRNALLQVFTDVANGFSATGKRIAHYEERITPLLAEISRVQKNDPWEKSTIQHEAAFKAFVEETTASLRATLNDQLKNMLSYQEKNRFRKKFDDSLMIYVYGKVKAGKSSLGNYIAWGAPSPDENLKNTASPKPAFFCETNTGITEQMSTEKMAQQQHFSVGVSETTSAIQGFTLPGLTWIDSPGIHSVNGKNGELAEDYTDAADLVIYLTNSSSPGRASDVKAMIEVLEKGKPLMALITSSDSQEEDEDDEGNIVSEWVMKSDADRADQENYVRKAIATERGSDKQEISVQTVSVTYASEGAESERNYRWQKSGLQAFAQTVAHIAHSDGIKIKQCAPLLNHKNLCSRLEEHSNSVIERLSDIEQRLKDAALKLEQARERESLAFEQRLQPKIDQLAHQFVMDDRQFFQQCEKVWHQESGASKTALLSHAKLEFDQLTVDMGILDVIEQPVPGFRKRIERIAFDSTLGENIGKASGATAGTLLGGALGSFIPGVGTMIGAGVGGLVGGYLGRLGGGKIGENFNSTEYEDIEVGDNRDEVAINMRKVLCQRADRELNALTMMVEKAFYSDIKFWVADIRHSLEVLQQELSSQYQSLSSELSRHEPA